MGIRLVPPEGLSAELDQIRQGIARLLGRVSVSDRGLVECRTLAMQLRRFVLQPLRLRNGLSTFTLMLCKTTQRWIDHLQLDRHAPS